MIRKIKQFIPLSIKKGIKKVLGIKEPENTHKNIYTEYAGKPILEGEEANEAIFQIISTNKPALIARLGSVEQGCLNNYIAIQDKKHKKWTENVLKTMPNNAGFFPASPKNLERFASEMIEHLKNLDILGVWFNEGEKYITENICPQADFVTLPSLEPYYHQNPWSRALEGKKVLVIHPFAESIKQQFQKREFLFDDKQILPNFDLQTIKAVQSIAGNASSFDTWFDALDYMTQEASKRDFDIAIIGAGAYGLPLASNIKKMGKQAIHLGGATQILFGIMGKRWEETPFFKNLINEHWIRPSQEEIPKNANQVEGGCYW